MSHPVYAFNNYLWKLLQVKEGWKTIDGLMPISDVDTRKFSGRGERYMIYAFTENDSPTVSAIQEFEITYAIMGPQSKTSKVNSSILMLSRAIKDEMSAYNVTSWINNPNNPNQAFRGINIVSVNLNGSENANPPETEGGQVDGYLMVTIQATSPNEDYSVS